MSSDDYQVQNVYRYSRKSYKKNCRRTPEADNVYPEDEINIDSDHSPRSVGASLDLPSCSCDLDPDGDVANILHKKCPVITLARQQLQRLLEDTDRILCDNTRCCRSVYDFLCICREVLLSQNKCICALLFVVGAAFFLGLLMGAASCGSHLGRFNSPILTCLNKLLVPDTYTRAVEYQYHGIA